MITGRLIEAGRLMLAKIERMETDRIHIAGTNTMQSEIIPDSITAKKLNFLRSHNEKLGEPWFKF